MFSKTLTNDEFAVLYDQLKVSSEYIEDVEIVDGKIRQPIEAKTLIVECDISDLFDKSLSIPNIKNKLPLLKVLLDDGGDIKISLDDENEHCVYFSSGKTAYRFTESNPSTFNTRYIEDEKFNENVVNNVSCQNELLVLKNDIAVLQKKIKTLSNAFSSKELLMKMDKKKYKLEIISSDKTQSAVLEEGACDSDGCYTYMLDCSYMNNGKNLESISFFKPFKVEESSDDSGVKRGLSYAGSSFKLNDNRGFRTYSLCEIDVPENPVTDDINKKEETIIQEEQSCDEIDMDDLSI